MTKMSITRGLVELKRLNDRINKAIDSGIFVSRTVGKDTYKKIVGTSSTPEQVRAQIISSYQSVADLIAQRQKIKSAIVLSNANTRVTVGGVDMSVAEAIELKGTLDFRKSYLSKLKWQLLEQNTAIIKANTALDATIDALLTTALGGEKAKADPALLESISKPQRTQKECELFDPMDIEGKIASVENDVSILESELDFILSESNARTEIEV